MHLCGDPVVRAGAQLGSALRASLCLRVIRPCAPFGHYIASLSPPFADGARAGLVQCHELGRELHRAGEAHGPQVMMVTMMEGRCIFTCCRRLRRCLVRHVRKEGHRPRRGGGGRADQHQHQQVGGATSGRQPGIPQGPPATIQRLPHASYHVLWLDGCLGCLPGLCGWVQVSGSDAFQFRPGLKANDTLRVWVAELFRWVGVGGGRGRPPTSAAARRRPALPY